MYTVFPVISRVRNMGHDGSGLHCGKNKLYENQPIYQGSKEAEIPFNLKPDAKINKVLKNHFKIKLSKRVLRFIKKLTYSLKSRFMTT